MWCPVTEFCRLSVQLSYVVSVVSALYYRGYNCTELEVSQELRIDRPPDRLGYHRRKIREVAALAVPDVAKLPQASESGLDA